MARNHSAQQPEPWTQQESGHDFSALIAPAIVATVILVGAFVWFVAHLMATGSEFGKLIAWLLSALAVVLIAGAIWGVIVLGRMGWNLSARVKPDVTGRYPMKYADLDAGGAPGLVMGALTQGHVLVSGRALPPGVQSVSQASTQNNMGGPFYDDEPGAEQNASPVTFAALAAAGEIGGGRDPIVGVDMLTGDLVRLNWEHGIGSIGIYGKPHSGKTVLGVVLAAQAVNDGGKLIVCDRHAGDVQSFATRMTGLEGAYLTSVAQSEKDIVAALALAVDVLNARMDGDSDRSPVLVMGEELTAMLIRMRDKVEPPMTLIGVEGRKYGVNIVTMAQAPQKELVGLFRDISMSAACFRHAPAMGRIATGMNVRNLLEYQPGDFCMMAANGDMYERLHAPEIVPADIVALSTSLHEPASLPRPPRHLTAVGSEPERVFSPEEELRIVDLFGLGKTTQEIVWEVKTRKPNGTREYRRLKEGVEDVFRRRLRDGSVEEES
jgi:hypothetical protein